MKFAFYEKALNLFKTTQENQIQKGLQKYPEPFNPHSWTPQELLNHALEETVDLTHYLVGLKDLLDVRDYEIRQLHKEIRRLKNKYEPPVFEKKPVRNMETKFKMDANGNLTRVQESPFEEQYPKYFDVDDQH